MARDPDCDFFVFRAAADGIVRDQIDRRLAQPSVCILRTLVFDVARHVWMAANPCTFTLVHSLAPRVGVAPVLTQQQTCFRLHFPTPACARQRFAWLHSSSWKASCPTSTAELVSVRCANTSKPIWSANTNWKSFSMTQSSQPRQSAFHSLTTTWSATKPSSRKQSDRDRKPGTKRKSAKKWALDLLSLRLLKRRPSRGIRACLHPSARSEALNHLRLVDCLRLLLEGEEGGIVKLLLSLAAARGFEP